MILGSHNTMTYLDPKNKWLTPFTFMARCQNNHIIDQYEAGARLFDFRFIFNKWGEPSFAHGIMEFSMDQEKLTNIFIWLDSKGKKEDIWVRVINERDENYYAFIKFCEQLKRNYPHVKFFGGINKKDWKILYDFGYGEPNMIDKYASQNFDVFGRGTGWYWDVSNAENMYGMFYECMQLKSVGDLSYWDVSKVKDMSRMFASCKELKSVGDLSNWNVSSIKNMNAMFWRSGITNKPDWYIK